MNKTQFQHPYTYECDVCNRQITITENRPGLTVLPTCNITLGCMGNLRRVSANERRKPKNTPSLIRDWVQRQMLFKHQQRALSNRWIIHHNLDNIPIVDLFVSKQSGDTTVLTPAEPLQIITIDANTTEIVLKNAAIGVAVLTTTAGQDRTEREVADTTKAEQYQVSANAEITVATLDNARNTSIGVTFRTAGGDVASEFNSIDDTPSIASPWVGERTAIINGRRYSVRSFNFRQTSSVSALFDSATVAENTNFVFTHVGSIDLKRHDLLIMLSTAPHTISDRDYNHFIDAVDAALDKPQLTFTKGNVYASHDVIRETYPQILLR